MIATFAAAVVLAACGSTDQAGTPSPSAPSSSPLLTGNYGGGNGTLGASPATFGGGGISVITGPVPREQDPPGLTLRAPYVGNGGAIIDIHVV